jgi:plasmid stability protein
MATLCVRNVPRDLDDAFGNPAKRSRRSIAAQVIALLNQFIPTEKELQRRREFVLKLEASARDTVANRGDSIR